MKKTDVYKLLEILDSNDCLHPEWEWSELDDNMEVTGELSDESKWVVEEINKLLASSEQPT